MTLSDLIPGVSEAKAIVGGVMVLGLVGLSLWVVRVNHLRAEHLAELQAAQAWQASVRQSTSAAAHIEKNGKPALLALDQVQPQIVYLGQALDNAHAAIGAQNKAIDAMADTAAAKARAGSDALARVEQARQAAQESASALRASAAANTTKNGACVPSAAFLANSGAL